jgi:hypothetical protein
VSVVFGGKIGGGGKYNLDTILTVELQKHHRARLGA